jgi:hypothetical protein
VTRKISFSLGDTLVATIGKAPLALTSLRPCGLKVIDLTTEVADNTEVIVGNRCILSLLPLITRNYIC